eukprot:9172747-Alexandrium_andersonii.AAC.1
MPPSARALDKRRASCGPLSGMCLAWPPPTEGPDVAFNASTKVGLSQTRSLSPALESPGFGDARPPRGRH